MIPSQRASASVSSAPFGPLSTNHHGTQTEAWVFKVTLKSSSMREAAPKQMTPFGKHSLDQESARHISHIHQPMDPEMAD